MRGKGPKADPFVVFNTDPNIRQVVKFKAAFFEFQEAIQKLDEFTDGLTILELLAIKAHVKSQLGILSGYTESVLKRLHQVDDQMYQNSKIGQMRRKKI